MAPTASWTPSKAHVFDVVVPTGNGPETVVDATASIVGLSEVYCVQHMGGLNFQVTVKSTASMTLIVDAGCLVIGGERCPVVPVGPQVTNVTCLFLPSFVPNEVLVQALSPYGKVLSVSAGLMSGRRGVLTGTRFVRMEMSATTPVPNYLRVSGHRVTFDYRGLQRVCRRCGSSDHYRAQCTAAFCGRCGVHGHESDGCDRPCRRCGDSHPTVACPVRRSYSDAATGAFPPLPPASAAVATAREAITKKIALTPQELASRNEKEEACSSRSPSASCSPASSTEKEDRDVADRNTPCSLASQAAKDTRAVAESASTSAATITSPDPSKVLNADKAPDPAIAVVDVPTKSAAASSASVASPTAALPLHLGGPPAAEVVGVDEINPAVLPLPTSSSSENSFSLGVDSSVGLSPSLDELDIEMAAPRDVKRAHASASGSDGGPDRRAELQRPKKPRPSSRGSKK
ncbi:uncharacterized protein [Dermacentor albipictus]|uniref:uncharacterized protein n=1 Tax=Dermacentor albipictus TaxID=60249 RepID=UPI0038FD2E76